MSSKLKKGYDPLDLNEKRYEKMPGKMCFGTYILMREWEVGCTIVGSTG